MSWRLKKVKDELVSYQINGHSAQGWLVRPEGEARGGVVVIQEWWGLNDNIKEIAGRVAGLGYVAIAPDLYDGKVANEPDEAQKLRMEMQLPEAVKKISRAADYLKKEHEVEKVAVMGFCMGGTLTLLGATTGEFALAAPFYGRVTDEIKANWHKINIPVIGFYGLEDHGISKESVEELKAQLDKNGIENEFHFYQAGHAFFNDTRESYSKEAAEDAWGKLKSWLEKCLR